MHHAIPDPVGENIVCGDIRTVRSRPLHRKDDRVLGEQESACGLDCRLLVGVIAILGGLSIILGFKAKYGAWLIILFLVPVTFMIHNFWTVADPMARQMQYVNFIKNISMLGAALLIAHFGSGPLSLDKKG